MLRHMGNIVRPRFFCMNDRQGEHQGFAGPDRNPGCLPGLRRTVRFVSEEQP